LSDDAQALSCEPIAGRRSATPVFYQQLINGLMLGASCLYRHDGTGFLLVPDPHRYSSHAADRPVRDAHHAREVVTAMLDGRLDGYTGSSAILKVVIGKYVNLVK
jgi:hypothetical protein